MLANVGCHVGLSVGCLIDCLHRFLRLNNVLTVIPDHSQAILFPPPVYLLPPFLQHLLLFLRTFSNFRLKKFDHFIQDYIYRPNDRNIRLNSLGDRRRIDIEMDNFSIRAKLGNSIRYAVIKAGPNSKHKVAMMHGIVCFKCAMHTKHAQKLFVCARKCTQPH